MRSGKLEERLADGLQAVHRRSKVTPGHTGVGASRFADSRVHVLEDRPPIPVVRIQVLYVGIRRVVGRLVSPAIVFFDQRETPGKTTATSSQNTSPAAAAWTGLAMRAPARMRQPEQKNDVVLKADSKI